MFSYRKSVHLVTQFKSNCVKMLQYLLILDMLLSTLTKAEVYKLPVKKMRVLSDTREKVSRTKRDGELKVTKDNLGGDPAMGYFLEMGIGTPPQTLNVLLDTGSSNFAIAAAPDNNIDKYFNTSLSSTYNYDGTSVRVVYTQGEWTGPLAHEQVTAPSIPSLNISADIAFITESVRFFQNGSNWQGILGLAYAEIIQPDESSVVPFMDSLIGQTNISAVFSLQLCGVKDTHNDTAVSTGGTMTLGGIDSSLHKGALLYASLRREWYYEVIITDILIDGESLNLECKEYNFDRSIVDSGTTDLRLPPTVFNYCVNMLRRKIKIIGAGGTIEQPPDDFWVGGSVICWEEYMTPWLDFPTLTIQIATDEVTTFDLVLSPQQYLLEVKDVYNALNQLSDCYKFAVAPSESGSVLGAVLMEGFYVVFDRQEKRVGFAETSCPIRIRNAVPSSVKGPHSVTYNTSMCGYQIPRPSTAALSAATYIIISLAVICGLPVVLFVFQWFYHTHCKKQRSSNKSMHDENDLLETDLDSR